MMTEIQRNYSTVEVPRPIHDELKKIALERKMHIKSVLLSIVRDYLNQKNNLSQELN